MSPCSVPLAVLIKFYPLLQILFMDTSTTHTAPVQSFGKTCNTAPTYTLSSYLPSFKSLPSEVIDWK